MASVLIEIRSAEGGDDSKLLVREQLNIYAKFAARQNLDLELLDEQRGMVICRLSGSPTIIEKFARYEVGGMRWQRVPPNEKRGRVHTSTVTVSVLDTKVQEIPELDRNDVEFTTCRGSGAGGQHRNVTDSAVQATHKPSGLMVRVESERSQHQNKASALTLLAARLAERAQAAADRKRNDKRKEQVGSGMRGDKRRTIAVQRGQVVDHVTGKKTTTKAYFRGDVSSLW